MIKECAIVDTPKSRMSFRRGSERFVYADVQRYIATSKPRATALSEFFGLWDFLEPENVNVEFSSHVLAAPRNGQLYMV